MTTEEAALFLDLSLYEVSTDQDDIYCKALLQALADGTKEPVEAAKDLDAWVTHESTRRLEEFRARPELIERTAQGSVSRVFTPNASGYIERFFQGFPRLCAIFPPGHTGQTRVIKFLDALMAIPEHQVLDSFPDANDLSKTDMLTLWPRGVVDPNTFRVYAAELDHVGSGLEIPGSEAAARWRNYQAALARITMAGFSNCSFLCGLRDILPEGKKITLPTPKVQCKTRPADIGGRLEAAAQWLAGPEEAHWVYQQCSERQKTDSTNPRDTWSAQNWAIWKAQLELYASDDRVELRAREAARKALEQMKAVEA